MTDGVEGSTMVVPRAKLMLKQRATIISSAGRFGLYKNPYGEDDMLTRR